MGGGFYNTVSRSSRAEESGYFTLDSATIFTQSKEKRAHPDMLIYGKIREARDSAEHPNSIPKIIALDVTGSMLSIPRLFIQDGLPTIISDVLQAGIPDPQLCFCAIGDHECDSTPFQAGQFESSDELMDKWLTSVYLEGGGGGNAGESYALAWKFAADHTSCDHIEKRGKKGLLFSIGDEPNLRKYPAGALNTIFGGQNQNETDESLFNKASKNWDLYHISIEHDGRKTNPAWKQLFGDRLIVINDFKEIPKIIANLSIKQVQSDIATSPMAKFIDETVTAEAPKQKITL